MPPSARTTRWSVALGDQIGGALEAEVRERGAEPGRELPDGGTAA
jgi:hypothetical protein